MTTKHTPSPWTAKGYAVDVDTVYGGRETIAAPATCYQPERHAEFEANARLIAASPELLDALRAFVEYAEAQKDEECASCFRLGQILDEDCDEHYCAFIKPRLLKARAAISKATGEK